MFLKYLKRRYKNGLFIFLLINALNIFHIIFETYKMLKNDKELLQKYYLVIRNYIYV